MMRWLTAIFLLAPLLSWSADFARAQAEGPELRLDVDQNLHLEAGARENLSLCVPFGQVVSVIFKQMAGMVSVTSISADGSTKDPYPQFNRSGRLSSIVFHTVGLKASEDASPSRPMAEVAPCALSYKFLLENTSKSTADVQISVAKPQPISATDAEVAQADRATAKAIASSANRAASNAPVTLQLLKAAETLWRAAMSHGIDPADASVELTRILALEAYTQAFPLNEGAPALTALPELLKLAAEISGTDAAEAANAKKTAAFVYAKQAMYNDALQQYNEALELYRQTEDTYNKVVVLENRAKIERIEGHNVKALDDVQTAIPLAKQNSDGRGELALEVERGAIAYASGQLGIANEANVRAISLAQDTHDDYLEGLAWSDLGVVYTEVDDFEEANRAFDSADAIWKRVPNAYGQIQTSEDRAELHLAEGDFSGARTAFAEGHAEAAKSSLDREQVYFLHGLAVSELRSGKSIDSEKHLNQAVAIAERVHLSDALSSLYSSAGDMLAQQDRWDKAEREWLKADAATEKDEASLDHVIALGGLVRAALHLGKLDQASGRCQQAMSALESIRAGITASDLRLSFFSSRHALYDLCVQTELRRGDQKAAFEAAERGRARSLLDQAAASGIEAEFPHGLIERIQQNETQLKSLRGGLSNTARTTAKSESAENMASALRTREKLRAEAEQSGLNGRLAAATLPLTEQEVMARLDSSTALLEYWLGRESSCAWLILNNRVSVYKLPSASVLRRKTQSYMASLLAPLALNTSVSAVQRAHSLAASEVSAAMQGMSLKRMLMPMEVPARIRRLLIVKDGAILSISFAALPVAGHHYLGELYELATEPSATFASRATRPSPGPLKLSAVVFTDPSNANGKPIDSKIDSPSQVTGLTSASWSAPLPYAREEAVFIRQTFGENNTKIFAGSAASRSNALGFDWSSYQVAHFATHAVFRKNHFELSGMILASSETQQRTGHPQSSVSIMTYADILRLNAPLQLVVLSACGSGVGKFVPGEGMLALDTAFLASGTSRAIGTLWPVEDEASSVFMRHFYNALARNHSPARSLQIAQVAMTANPRWSSPYYWGAFSLSGDWHPFPD